jgi:hypothetical protein
MGREYAVLTDSPGRITHRFHARDLHLVLAPDTPARPIRFRVKLDGAPPGVNHGVDVDADGMGTVQGGRLYQRWLASSRQRFDADKWSLCRLAS